MPCPYLGAEQLCALIREAKTFKCLSFIPVNALVQYGELETESLTPNLHEDKYLQGIETLLHAASRSVAFLRPHLPGP